MLQPVLVRAAGDGFELIAGERRWRAARRIGLQTIPGDRPDRRRRRDAPAGDRRERPARGAEPARGSRRVSTAHRGLLAHPRRRRDPGRQEPRDDHEHVAAAAAPAVDPALRSRTARCGWATPARCSAPPTARSRSSSPSASSPRTSRCARSRRRSGGRRGRARRPKPRPRRGRAAEAAAARAARARGAARRLPRDPGQDLDGPAPRPGRDRVRDPRGPRAHLPGHDARARPPAERNRSSGSDRRAVPRRPRRMPSTSARAISGTPRRQHRGAARRRRGRRARTRPRPSASRAGAGTCGPTGSSTSGSTARSDSVMPCARQSPPSERNVWLAK